MASMLIVMKLLEEVNKKLKTNDVRGKMKRVDQSTLTNVWELMV